MWETICDAWACWSGWNFGPNPTEYPYSVEYPLLLPPPLPFPTPPLPFPLPLSLLLPLPQNENCQGVQIWGVPEYPPKWKLSESPNARCPRIPPKNENCHRVQIWGVPAYPPKRKLSESPNPRCPRIPPKMKIVKESKSEVSQNTPLKWKLS